VIKIAEIGELAQRQVGRSEGTASGLLRGLRRGGQPKSSSSRQPGEPEHGGVARDRQPSTAQQKVKRRSCSRPRRQGPCGSGNKYKKCCLAKEEAVAREQLVKAQAPRDTLRRDQRAAADRLQVTELTAAVAARLARAEEEDAHEDALDIASNAVVDLVHAAKLDEAEAAARDLLRCLPDVHDAWDRLGMVHEARGDSRQAADCYRKVIAFIRDHPDDYEPGFEEVFVKLVDRLDPPTAT
jgi:SEC-C motif